MSTEALLLFIVTDLLFTLSPGPAVLVTVSHALTSGPRAAAGAIVGINLGNFLWYALAALGLAALAETAPLAFTVIRYAGIAYLLWTGIRMWRKAGGKVDRGGDGDARRLSFGAGLMSGFAVHMANPKALLFYAAFLPQFIDPAGNLLLQVGLLAAITLVIETLILSLYAWIATRAGRLVVSGGRVRWLDRSAAAVLIGVALAMALLFAPHG